MNKVGYIYIIEDEKDICKVGVSVDYPRKRALELSSKFHRTFSLKGVYKSSNIYKEEAEIHELLRKYHIRGEWFKVPSKEICRIIEDEIITDDGRRSAFVRASLNMRTTTFDRLSTFLNLDRIPQWQFDEWMNDAIISKLMESHDTRN